MIDDEQFRKETKEQLDQLVEQVVEEFYNQNKINLLKEKQHLNNSNITIIFTWMLCFLLLMHSLSLQYHLIFLTYFYFTKIIFLSIIIKSLIICKTSNEIYSFPI